MWYGINNRLIGPYFYDRTLTGQRYLNFTQYILPDLIDDVPLEILGKMWFQQDGAPAHNAIILRHYLN